jgi:hypothetical protein
VVVEAVLELLSAQLSMDFQVVQVVALDKT